MFHDVPTFSRTCIFFLLIFSLLTLLTSAFQLSISSEVSLLNFLRLIYIYIIYIYIKYIYIYIYIYIHSHHRLLAPKKDQNALPGWNLRSISMSSSPSFDPPRRPLEPWQAADGELRQIGRVAFFGSWVTQMEIVHQQTLGYHGKNGMNYHGIWPEENQGFRK